MKIHEIISETILTELTRPDWRGAAKILQNSGWTTLGSGTFGDVYGHAGKPYVLKLFSYTDRAYLKYVSVCTSNANPHFPKFRGRPIKVTDFYYAIRMEPLKSYHQHCNGSNRIDLRSIWDYLKYTWCRDENNEVGTQVQYLYMHQLEETQPGILAACDILIKNFNSGQFDIHAANVMFRNDTLVFTDPVYSPEAELRRNQPSTDYT